MNLNMSLTLVDVKLVYLISYLLMESEILGGQSGTPLAKETSAIKKIPTKKAILKSILDNSHSVDQNKLKLFCIHYGVL